MKRSIFLTLLLSLIAIGLFAQTVTATIGDPESTLDSYGPMRTFNNYSVTQQIYTATELNDAGIITGQISKIAFQAGNVTIPLAEGFNWRVYMAETNEDTFELDGWIPLGDFTQVFSGDIGIRSLTADTWVEIQLTTLFSYTGNGNLVVMVNEYSGSYNYSEAKFKATNTTNNSYIYNCGDANSAYVPIGTTAWTASGSGQIGQYGIYDVGTARPNIQITYIPPVTPGFDLTISAFTAPAIIPSDPIMVRVTNLGDELVTNNSYQIDFYEVGASSNTWLYTISSTEGMDAAVPGVFDSVDYPISAEIYTQWPFATARGPITLKATVTIADDALTENNSRTFDTIKSIPVTVSGHVHFADTNDGVSAVTVHLGQYTATTGNDGSYTIQNVLSDLDYALSVGITATGYLSYTEDVFLDYDDAVSSVYTKDITIAEAMRQPLYVYAVKNTDGDNEISWYDPYTTPPTLQDFTLCPQGATVGGYGFWDYIAAHRYTAQNLNTLGLSDKYLVKVAFKPWQDFDNEFTIMIWTGVDLENPDVAHPTYSQPVTQALTAGEYNQIPLSMSILIPAGQELVIGIQSTGAQIYTMESSLNNGFGNKYYYDGNWTTVYDVSSSTTQIANEDNWQIIGYALTPEEATPTRAWGEKYMVYRLTEPLNMTTATALTTAPILISAAPFVDEDALTSGIYQYAVTSVYTGSNYPAHAGENWTESLPSFSNHVIIPFTVSGTLVSESDENVVGLTVTLTNTTISGSSPAPVQSSFGGAFTIQNVMPGEYQLTVSRPPNPTVHIHTDLVTVTDTNITDLEVTVPSAVSENENSTTPIATGLIANYPNPFNPTTTISFALANDGRVTIDIYNILGQKVKTLANSEFSAGKHNVVWHGDDFAGKSVGSGVYFYRMTANGYSGTQKMLLMK